MHTQTLQLLRAELESASTLHLAMGRIATQANPAAPTAWTGPLLEELEDLTDDDGGFSQAAVAEIRRRSAAALIAQFHAVRAAVDGAPPLFRKGLQELLDATLVTGTGNSAISTSAIPTVLGGLAKSGELRLDYTMRAAMLARDGLPKEAAPVAPEKKAPAAKKPVAKDKAPAARKPPAKKPGAKKPPTKKPAAKKKPVAKKPPAKKAPGAAARKAAPKKPAGKKK